MTNANLALWFGIGLEKLKKEKSERLAILTNYCKYHETGTTRKTLIIDEIYVAVYEGDKPKAKWRANAMTRNNWEKNGYDTIQNLRVKNKHSYEQEGYTITEGTIRNYTYLALKDLIGYSKERAGAGAEGVYEKLWGKANPAGSEEAYSPLSDSELRIKAAVSKKFFNEQEDEELVIASIVQDGHSEGLTEKEIDQNIGLWRKCRHEQWKAEVEKALGFEILVLIKVECSAFRYENSK